MGKLTSKNAESTFRRRRLLSAAIACFLTPAASAQETTPRTEPTPAESVQPDRAASQREGAIETWDVLLIDGRQAGYRRTLRIPTPAAVAGPTLTTSVWERMQVLRGGQPFIVDLHTHCQERQGRVVMFSYRERSGAPNTRRPTHQIAGRVIDGKIHWQRAAASPGQALPQQWPAGADGYFALEESLREQPLSPGDERRFTSLAPMIDQFVDTRLVARDHEAVELLDGSTRLLRVEVEGNWPGGVRIASTLWCDANGDVLKSETPAMKLSIYRTDRETALRKSAAPADLFDSLIVKLDRPLQQPHDRQRITYEVEVPGKQPEDAFPGDARQEWSVVESRPRLTASATWVDSWNQRPDVDPQPAPAAAALRPSRLIDYDDPRVKALADRIGRRESDAWQLALKLERVVNETIVEKNLESMLAPASEVAISRAGDCTEHAVLLAALCRARELPARVAIGLVYVPQSEGFLYHMWTEVWVEDSWRPLDATFARGGIGAAHLKISDSLLDEENPYTTVLPVLNVVGQVKLRAISEE